MSKRDSNILKGLAVILMLIHHLEFANVQDVPVMIGNPFAKELWTFLTVVGKICVAMFVFVTGYGTTKSVSSEHNIYDVSKKTTSRYVNLLLSYQFLFVLALIFAPLSYDRFAVYGEDVPTSIVYFLIDFFGCADVLGTPTYNATWWYMSLALTLIAVFPILLWLCKKCGFVLLPAFFFVLRYFNTYFTMSWYIPIAVLGILCAQQNVIEKVTQRFTNTSFGKKLLVCAGLMLTGAFFLFLRYKTTYWWDVFDLVITFILVLIVCLVINKIPFVSSSLAYIGRHSMNIFLVHTFYFHYWFREHIYSFKYPILILLMLLLECLLVSIVIELIKKKIRFNVFSKKIGDKLAECLYIGEGSSNEQNRTKDA